MPSKQLNPALNYRRLRDILRSKGFKFVRQKGSHEIYVSPTGKTIVLPRRKSGHQMHPKFEKQILAASNPMKNIDRARELWVRYTIKPSKTSLAKVKNHCETLMSISSSSEVQRERKRCMRAVAREEKLLSRAKRNPISIQEARCRKRHQEFRDLWWKSIVEQVEEEGLDIWSNKNTGIKLIQNELHGDVRELFETYTKGKYGTDIKDFLMVDVWDHAWNSIPNSQKGSLAEFDADFIITIRPRHSAAPLYRTIGQMLKVPPKVLFHALCSSIYDASSGGVGSKKTNRKEEQREIESFASEELKALKIWIKYYCLDQI